MQQNKLKLSDDNLPVLLKRLAHNVDIRMAGHVLQSNIIRYREIDCDSVISPIKKYPHKYLQHHLKKRQQT